jgi:predicted nuclease of predicted toxin-antitoxin system
MRILVDENIPRMTVDFLRSAGHNVTDVRGSSLQGSPDSDIWALAVSDGRLLITTDKGFSQYRSKLHHGILIVRLRQPNRHKIHEAVVNAVGRFEGRWPNLFVVVRDTTISISSSSPT